MQFSYGGDVMPALAQQVMPAGCLAVVGIDIVPVADLAIGPSGCQRRARGYTNGVGTTGLTEARTACGKGIEMGRLDFGVPRTTHDLRVVFIRQYNQKIAGILRRLVGFQSQYCRSRMRIFGEFRTSCILVTPLIQPLPIWFLVIACKRLGTNAM